MARWLNELPWGHGSLWPWGRWRDRDERGWPVALPPSLRFRRLPQARVCEPQDGREENSASPHLPRSSLGIRVLHAMGPGKAQWVGRGKVWPEGVRDGRSEYLAGLQAQRSWAGGSQGLGTGVALGPMAWQGRLSSSLLCPGWWGCGSEDCSIPALETENQPGSLPTAQVSGNPGPTRVSAESLGLLSSPALLQRAAACPLPTASSSQLLCQLPGRHASRHPLQIHVHGHACVYIYLHM